MNKFCVLLLGTVWLASAQVPKWCAGLPRAGYSALERVAVPDEWFEVYKAAPSVFAIYEPHQSEETISYLILGDKQALLFDTGMGIGDLKKVVMSLTKLPVTVLNSHTHFDHVGSNWQFDAIYGMDTAFTRLNAKGSKEDAQSEIGPEDLCGSLPKGFDSKSYVTRPWKITTYKHDGDNIELGGRKLRVISTPGHTPDAICLFDEANGLLFTGDTYYPGTIWLNRPETDLPAYSTSLDKILALLPAVKNVLGAHNFPGAPPEVIRKLATAFAEVRAGKVLGKPAPSGKMRYQSGDISFLMRAN